MPVAMLGQSYMVHHLQKEAQRLSKFYGKDSMKALAHWAVRQIDPGLDDNGALAVVSIDGPGDRGIDAIWEHSNGKDLCVAQIKGSRSILSADVENIDEEDDGFEPESFDDSAVIEVGASLDKLVSPPGVPTPRLARALKSYQQAVRDGKNIVLSAVVFGQRKKAFDEALLALNGRLDKDRKTYARHQAKAIDLVALNELMDRDFEEPPKVLQIPTAGWSFGPVEVRPGYYLALVPAMSLVQIRRDQELRIYHSNYRFTLGPTIVRGGMESTLSDGEERKLFHLYHNGINIVGREITPQPGQLKIDRLQVVNGLQTIETLFDFAKKSGDAALEGVNVFVRFIDVTKQSAPGPDRRSLEEKIAEYSNKQNPILPRDLRSNDAVQKRLQHEIDAIGFFRFQRKRGQYGRGIRGIVDNEVAAQQILSFWQGKPAEAKNKKKMLFVRAIENPDGLYEKVFYDGMPSEAVLIPYLLYQKLPDGRGALQESVVEHGDLILLAMWGTIFQAWSRVRFNRAGETSNRERLEGFFRFLNSGTVDREVARISNELLRRLTKSAYAELERRKSDALRNDKREPTLRNVLFNLKYSAWEKKLLPTSVLKGLTSRLKRAI
jgi:AIPR protein